VTPADRRLAALATLLVPDASAAALRRMGGPEGAAIADLASRLARIPEAERLAALAGAMPGPLPVEDEPPCALAARLRLERLAVEAPAPVEPATWHAS
jgi:hypothetical protein